MKKILFLSSLLLSVNVLAITIRVIEDTCSLAADVCDDITEGAQAAVDGDFPDASLGNYASGIADANSFAYKGSTSEYADLITLMSFKVSGGLAVSGDLDSAEQADGIGFGAAVTAGLNLDLLPVDKIGPVDLSKMDLFVTFMSYNMNQDQGDLTTDGELSAFGVMARYPLVEPKSFIGEYLVQWGGVHLHTGFLRSSMNMSIINSFEDEDFEDDSSGTTVYGSFQDGEAEFSIDSTVNTIPVEVSTYIRLAYVFTVYGGLGVDLQSGSTDIDLEADGDLTASDTDGGSEWVGIIEADDKNNGAATAMNTRAFAGVQFNVPFARFYTQFNKGLGSDLVGINLGLKIIY